MENIKKIPYGEADYGKVIRKNMFYVDKTRFIHELENLPSFIFLIRPRRFGKSLWINLLQYYYDINMKDKFDELFKNTYVGQNPTPDKNSFLTIAFNFSMVNPSINNVQTYFEKYILRVIEDFLERYHSYFNKNEILKINSFSLIEEKLQEIFFICSRKTLEVYMFIDEYDNFTNTILTTSGTKAYTGLTHGEGQFRHFFNLLKGLTSMPNAGLSKLFITGVSPVTMDDVTSGFNIGTNISLDGNINEFMGFTESEVRSLLNYYHKEGLLTLDIEFSIDLMKKWYNNYTFSSDANTQLFNTDMILFFIQKAIIRKSIPEKLIDQNIKIDYKKLRYLVTIDNQLNGNFSRLKDITFDNEITSDIVDSFPVEEITNQENFVSLLYYFGLLSIKGIKDGHFLLKIPNITVQKLMYEYIRNGFKDVDIFKVDISLLSKHIRDMAFRGDWKPFFQFLSDQIDRQTSIRDYLNGEKVIQGFLLAYLNVTDFYITQSESDMNKGFSDIFMEPFISKYHDLQYSYLIELKYISRNDYSEKKQLEKIKDAKKQLNQYSKSERIIKSIGNTKLKKIILVYKGWELDYCEEY
ncbi:putative AAA-ATPase [Candidatus Magnetomorum sp. HK-1]|nr:putative AAA-ATPase [Candidatus Magnetomorum sp. HK-1]